MPVLQTKLKRYNVLPIVIDDGKPISEHFNKFLRKHDKVFVVFPGKDGESKESVDNDPSMPQAKIDRWEKELGWNNKRLQRLKFFYLLDAQDNPLQILSYIFATHIYNTNYKKYYQNFTHVSWCDQSGDLALQFMDSVMRKSYHDGEQKLLIKHRYRSPIASNAGIVYKEGFRFLTEEMLTSNDPEEEYLLLS